MTELIEKRYRLDQVIGSGGMSTVYRAYDRLTGHTVALKRVLNPDEHEAQSNEEMRLALAQEFRTLASLRHPNIISVLDYGFDHIPYFTMDLIHDGTDILTAGYALPPESKVFLLVQTLQALTYLHRRGIIHRDLKPANVLVLDNAVKVLDFGLSVAHDNYDPEITAGTLAYMAPEVLQQSVASEASDLYAIGVMLYQMFAGSLPFNQDRLTDMIENILTVPPDMTRMDAPPALVDVTVRLLMKDPLDRYDSASEAIQALSQAVDRQPPPETAAIRESFLQSARLIGRDVELSMLGQALNDALAGQGGAWLIGGESGVGKTRLVDEVRTLGMVRGALALRGQAVSDGGTPYQMWRSVIRWLCLTVPLDDREAGVLKEQIVRDIDTLLDREIPPPPSLEPSATQTRLQSLVVDLFRRFAQADDNRPMLIVFEDLQWAGSEDIALLRRLLNDLERLPVIILATFRDDEAANLVDKLPGSQLLKLDRLDEANIAALSQSILGDRGRQPEVVSLLQRETEGNVFFLVEVVRALAEEAGTLDQIGMMTLPQNVFTGGVQRVVERRLNRVSREHYALLQLAAVVGREIDLAVMAHAAPETDIDEWIRACSDAAVIDVGTTDAVETRWRFAHDKLREALLDDLQPADKRAYHAQVAGALEATRADDPAVIPALAHHWEMAGDVLNARGYLAQSGMQTLKTGAYQEAIDLFERALRFYDGAETASIRARLERQRGNAYLGLGRLEQARAAFAQALDLLGYGLPEKSGALNLRLAGETMRQIARLAGLRPRQGDSAEHLLDTAQVYEKLAEICYFNNDVLAGVYTALRGLNLAEKAGPSPALARAYASMCIGAGLQSIHWLARRYGSKALDLLDVIDDAATQANVNLMTGVYYAGIGEWETATHNFETAAQMFEHLGDRKRLEQSLTSMAHLHAIRGHFDEVIALNRAVFSTAADRDDQQMIASSLIWQAAGNIMRDDAVSALSALENAEPLYQNSPDAGLQLTGYGCMAVARLRVQDTDGGLAAAVQALALMEDGPPTSFSALPVYAALAGSLLMLWEATADDHIQAQVERVLTGLDQYTEIFPIGDPFRKLWAGNYAWLSGEPAVAMKSWQDALNAGAELQMPYVVARAHYEIGRYTQDADQRERHLTQARRQFDALNLPLEISRIDDLIQPG